MLVKTHNTDEYIDFLKKHNRKDIILYIKQLKENIEAQKKLTGMAINKLRKETK